MTVLLASRSEIRARLLRDAAVPVETVAPKVDETAVKQAMLRDGAAPRDIADALAEMKAVKVSAKHPAALVIGCDQVLDHQGVMMSKPRTAEEARLQLTALRASRHELLSAAVICREGRPIWRHVGVVRLTMRAFSDAYLAGYLERNWHSIRHSVGGYKLEEEGVRLFARIDGDYFTVLGLPLLEILDCLTAQGALES